MATFNTGTPVPNERVTKFTILVEASMLLITLYSVCLHDGQNIEEKIMDFYCMTKIAML